MSVHEEQRADGTVVFKVRWRQGGKNRAKAFNSAKLGGRRAAERAARAFDGKMAAAQALGEAHDPDRGRITLADYVDQWLERPAFTRLADSTQDAYAVQLDRRLLPQFGGWSLRDLTPAEVEMWVTRLRDQRDGKGRRRHGEPSILKALTVLQAILNRAVIDGEIASNPVKLVDKPRQERARTPPQIAPIYVERMRSYLRERGQVGDAVLLCLLAYAGPRPESEGITLTWDRVRKRTLLIAASKHHGRERTVPIEAPLARDLAEWRLQLPVGQQLVVPYADGRVVADGAEWGRKGFNWDTWRRGVFQPAAAAAGLPAGVRPRDLRGSYATLLIYEGLKITEIARRLGHSGATCMKYYAGVFEEFDPAERIAAADAIDRARRAASFPPGSREETEALKATG